VTNWTNQAPVSLVTGPDQSTILQAVVDWGSARATAGKKVGVVAGNRASDQVPSSSTCCPTWPPRRHPVVETIDADPDDTAPPTPRPLVVQQLGARGDLGHPLMPFNVFYRAPGRDRPEVLPSC